MEPVIEEKEKFFLTDFVVKGLIEKTDSSQFRDFLKENELRSSGSKGTKLYKMKVSLDKMTEEKFNEDIKLIEEFFLEQIKYNSNRIILTFPFELRTSDPLNSVSQLENFKGNTIEELNFSKLFDETTAINHDFEKISQEIIVSSTKIQKVNQVYVRKVRYSDVREKYEFVWIEIDCLSHEIRIHLENNSKNVSVDLQGKPMSIYKHFIGQLMREFLIIAQPNPQATTLFKLYRKLTAYAEDKYLKEVEIQQEEIDEFTQKMICSEKLDIENTLDIANRIKWVFVRQLIQNDFDNFLKIQQRGDGKVKSILFHYDEGGSINANSGSSNESNIEELDLERQSAYFDTRESIYSSQKLFSITVNWSVRLPDNTVKEVLTRYRAYNQFLMTHILKENYSKGVYDDVFPRIKQFENLPL